jgi:hypothetical protein
VELDEEALDRGARLALVLALGRCSRMPVGHESVIHVDVLKTLVELAAVGKAKATSRSCDCD